ncbi:aldehyde dehydrogenase cytochrome c subunit [Acetobacter estunensis NRIC 0472]|uniref:C-type cytochrome n=1 Tax=Acetobacter estunensis TaxID=104097 RepID=A0A967EHS4_9PROT|nr:cytochrome c [Acetobacter estunensis]NHO54112.1 c-type cytochrome [Acetobacter estunensis]GBQ20827.1 aldehyde dehydrogenase cytochrome c subunit [Acetobacter estunensis NRIC 0472]
MSRFSHARALLTGSGLATLALLSSLNTARADSAVLARGEYLARASDCEACHTAPGGVPFAGGRAFNVPGMGVLYSSNITPDPKHGIGKWTDEEFTRSVREGISPGWKHLYPAMPYPAYARMSPAEVKDLRAWLATVPKSANTPPANRLRFPFSIRAIMIGWNLLNGPRSSYPDDPSKSAEWNRGRTLVEGPGHCADCHSPRTLTSGLSTSRAFAGNTINGLRAYNITPDRTSGIGGWTDEALAQYLATGHADGHGTASADMAEVITYSLRHLTPGDIRAMVTYLRDLKPVASDDAPAPSRVIVSNNGTVPQNTRGGRLFVSACAGCHLADGSGRQTPYANIAGARSLSANDGHNLIRIIMDGSSLTTRDGSTHAMPGFAGGGYSRKDLTDITSFVMTHFTEATPSEAALNKAMDAK